MVNGAGLDDEIQSKVDEAKDVDLGSNESCSLEDNVSE